jgi:hypothetical protein
MATDLCTSKGLQVRGTDAATSAWSHCPQHGQHMHTIACCVLFNAAGSAIHSPSAQQVRSAPASCWCRHTCAGGGSEGICFMAPPGADLPGPAARLPAVLQGQRRAGGQQQAHRWLHKAQGAAGSAACCIHASSTRIGMTLPAWPLLHMSHYARVRTHYGRIPSALKTSGISSRHMLCVAVA